MFGRHLLLAICLVVTIGGVQAWDAVVKNGGFEKTSDGQPVGWKSLGSGITVKPFVSAGWNRTEMTFNSAQYEVIRVYLGIHRGTGTVWLDNVRIDESTCSNLKVVNPSFEEGDAKTLTGWFQDAPGERTFRDTTVWTRFPGQGFGSGASARVTSPDGDRTRIWQDFGTEQFKRLWDVPGGTSSQYPIDPCEPNTDYVLSFAWRAEDFNGQLDCVSGIFNRLTSFRRAQKFPDAASFKIALSGSDSASSFLNRPFSFSTAFRRFAWSIRKPPYSLRQRISV